MKSRRLFSFFLLAALEIIVPISVWAQPLTGNKVIGTAGDYPSLTAAITDLNTKGASGTLTFLIDGDLTESGSPEITTTTLAGSNKLIIKPNTGKTPTVTFNACATSGNKGNAGLVVSGTLTNVGNITIDGSNTNGGTSKDMAFALSDTTNGRYAIRLNGETDNLTIKNLKIIATNIKPTTASASRTYGVYGLASGTAAADSLTITNCEIGSNTSSFYFGIYKPDGGTVPFGSALTISKNRIFAQHKGISIWGADGASNINDNTISIIGHPTGVYVHSSINGIYVESWKGTLNIFSNKIITMKAKAIAQTALRSLYGILVYYATGSGITGQTANVYNNFISDFSYSGDATTFPSEIIGMAIDALDQIVNVSYNTIYINNNNITTNPTYGIRVYDDIGQSVNLKNNIVVNTVNHDSAYAIYCSPIVNTCLKTSDYNDLYVAGANANVGYYNTAKYKTLANWQTISALDVHSINVNPANPFGAAGQLTSLTDLHWVSKPLIAFAGTPITSITTDIDGDTRSTTKPYMGADEGVPLTGIVLEQSGPGEFELKQNYPNPFNPSTTISFSLMEKGLVSLKVYDVLGKEVTTLVNNELDAGSYSIKFTGDNLSSGVYLYRLMSGAYSETKTMILAK